MGFAKSLKMIFKYSFKSSRAMSITIFLMTIGSLLSAIVPWIVKSIVDGINPETPQISMLELIFLVFLSVGIGLTSTIVGGYARYISGIMSTKAVYFLRRDIYRAINRQSFSFFDKTETGQLISRATSDIEATSMLFNMGISFAIQSVVSIVITLISITLMTPSNLALMLWIGIPIYVIIVVYIAGKLRIPFIESREVFGDLTTIIRENIIGSQVVRIFNSKQKEKEKFNNCNQKFLDLSVKAIKLQSILGQFGRFFIGIMTIFTFYFGGLMVFNDPTKLDILIAFIFFLTILYNPLYFFIMILSQFVQADASLTRVNEVLELTPEIKEDKNPISTSNISGDIVFKNVDFGYTSTMVLKNLNFSAKSGEKIALLGTTGSGKSTLISLLPRFYDPVSGEITIDGINIRKYKLKELRTQIGLVSQNIFLFNSTIGENIAFGKEDASFDEIKLAAESANISDFIESLPDKYETVVGERGTQLSGGQKQRIAIARALIIKPKILILDDSTSSVDVETEYKIQSALKNLMGEQTTFIITQRISTIRDAEKILVMDKGRIIGIGTHEVLFDSNPLYRQIYETLYRKQKQSIVDIPNEKMGELKHE